MTHLMMLSDLYGRIGQMLNEYGDAPIGKVESPMFSNEPHTTAAQDIKVLREFLGQMTDDMLVEEVVNRELLSEIFIESKRSEQQAIIDEWADNFGYTKSKE